MKKIVRTKIPIASNKLKEVDYESSEAQKFLRKKIIEEAKEVVTAPNQKEIAKEIGDLLDVIDATLDSFGITKGLVDSYRNIKRVKRGGFITESGKIKIWSGK